MEAQKRRYSQTEPDRKGRNQIKLRILRAVVKPLCFSPHSSFSSHLLPPATFTHFVSGHHQFVSASSLLSSADSELRCLALASHSLCSNCLPPSPCVYSYLLLGGVVKSLEAEITTEERKKILQPVIRMTNIYEK